MWQKTGFLQMVTGRYEDTKTMRSTKMRRTAIDNARGEDSHHNVSVGAESYRLSYRRVAP